MSRDTVWVERMRLDADEEDGLRTCRGLAYLVQPLVNGALLGYCAPLMMRGEIVTVERAGVRQASHVLLSVVGRPTMVNGRPCSHEYNERHRVEIHGRDGIVPGGASIIFSVRQGRSFSAQGEQWVPAHTFANIAPLKVGAFVAPIVDFLGYNKLDFEIPEGWQAGIQEKA